MKTFSLFLGFSLPVLAGFSQTLTVADIRPLPGESFLQHRLLVMDSVAPGNPGSGQIWDWSHAVFDASEDVRLVEMPISATPYPLSAGTFAIETYLVSDSANTTEFTFYQDTLTGYYELEEYGNPLYISHSDPEFLFRMPMSYGDSTADTECFSSTAFSVTYNYCGTGQLKYDGTGTLVLPSGSYPGVSRFRKEVRLVRQTVTDTSVTVQYQWFLPGVRWPVARYTAYLDPNGVTYLSGAFLDLTTLGQDATSGALPVSLYPNPAVTECRLETPFVPTQVCILDISGRMMKQYAGNTGNTMVLPVGDLPAGIYFVQVTGADGRMAVRRLVLAD